jgi:colicin import membrane protein
MRGMRFGFGLLLAAGAVWAAPGPSAAERFPKGSVSSLETAEQALVEVEKERAETHARYAKEERACHSRFFVSRCIEQAKERRRRALLPLEALELEARRFQRQQRAEERDKAMMERRARAEEKAAQAEAAAPQQQAPARPSPPSPPAQPQGKPREREPKPLPTPEQEQQAARERAENEAAYARKVEAAKARQEAVQKRKAEKERKHAGASPAGH